MTTQPTQPPPSVDPANPVAGETPTALAVTTAHTPNGKRIILTIRTASGSNWVFLDRDVALQLAQGLATEAQQLGGLIVPNGVLR